MANPLGDLILITLILDCQYGSTGKGNLAGFLASQIQPKSAMSLNAPNAGHSAYKNGKKYVFCALPIAAIEKSVEYVFLGPGSVINLENLAKEIAELPNKKFIYLHEGAAYVTQEDRDDEKSLVRIGSTMKGTSAAVARKLSRTPGGTVGSNEEIKKQLQDLGVQVRTAWEYQRLIMSCFKDGDIIAEGSQGFSLSINQGGFYPYCTSRDCTTAQAIADLGIPWPLVKDKENFKVVGVARTYPIRVANRFNEAGEQIGTSGPCYPDQQETSFETIGVPVEYTTVTKLPRRVFTFSTQQILDAVEANGIDEIAVTFLDYLDAAGRESFLGELAFALQGTGARIRYLADAADHVSDLDLVTSV